MAPLPIPVPELSLVNTAVVLVNLFIIGVPAATAMIGFLEMRWMDAYFAAVMAVVAFAANTWMITEGLYSQDASLFGILLGFVGTWLVFTWEPRTVRQVKQDIE